MHCDKPTRAPVEDAAQPSSSTSNDARLPRHLAIFFLAAAALQIIVVVARTGHVYYFSDDFLNFAIYRSEGFDRHYLLHPVFGQIVPAYRATQALMLEAFGLNYVPALVVICMLTTGSLLVVISIGLRVGASFPVIIAIALLCIFQLHLTDAQLWWSAGLHTLPGLLAVLLGLWFLVGPDGRPNDHGALAAAVCFGAGLLFFSKVMFAAAIYLGVLVFLRQRGRPISALYANAGAAIWQLRFVILVAIGWSLVLHRLTNTFGGPKPSFGVVIETIWKSVSDGTTAALLGLGSHGAIPFDSHGFTVALSLLVLAALVVATFRTAGPSVAILWIGYGAYFLGAMGIIAMTRAQYFTSDVGRSLRYNAESATLLLVTLLIACASGGSPSPRWRRGGAIVVGLAALVALNLQIQSKRIPNHWDVVTPRNYVDTLSRSLAELRGKPGVTIADEPAPEKILPAWMAPQNRLQFFMRLFPSAPPVVALDQATHRIAPDGSIVPR